MKSSIGLIASAISTCVLFGYLVFIWWLDRYEREPFWLIALVFGWGATIGVGGGCCLNASVLAPFRESLGSGATLGVATVVVAPVVEELTKGLVFIPLAWSDHFDNVTDGLIYGAAAGLGFATVENFLYFGSFIAGDMGVAAMLGSITMRTLFTAVMHCISTALLGMTVGYARHREVEIGNLTVTKQLVYPLVGYGLAVANHAIWNVLAILSGLNSGFRVVGAAVIVAAGALLFGLTQWSLRREHQILRRFLEREAERGVIPDRHAEIIPYWAKRRRSGWLDGDVDRDAYVRAATLLAFRHHQRELAPDDERQHYTERVERYRRKVRQHLDE